jgi:hypothetical protein
MEDRSSHFLSCLKEIQKSYIALPKIQRLRVEHWVEKLSLTGGNISWIKDRDMYTKMLLNMVLAKKLEAPFDRSPLDGPLPPFPSQYKCKLKNMIGPHETSFWRDVYSNVSDLSNIEKHIEKPRSNKSHKSLHLSDTLSGSVNRSGATGLDETLLSRRENDNISFLNQELDRRVSLLEQQLQEERLKHEIEMQRLLNEQRQELGRMRETAQHGVAKNANSLNTSVDQSSQYFGDILRSVQRESNSPLKSPTISASNFVKLNSESKNTGGQSTGQNSGVLRPKLSNSVNVSFSSSTKNGNNSFRGTPAQSNSKNQSSSFQLENQNEGAVVSPNRFLDEQEQIHHELMTTTDLSSRRMSPGVQKHSVMDDDIPSNEGDFLKYLEEFQDEIKSLRYKP